MGPKVFVSYRRGDSSYPAGRLRDRLVEAFGQERVFYDVDSIGFGQNFRQVIQDTLSDVDVVLLIIGDDWHIERLDSPGDYVRLEIEEALRQDKPLVPVLVGGATMPGPDELPESIATIAFHNAAPLRPDPDFNPDSLRLIEQLNTMTVVESVDTDDRRVGPQIEHGSSGQQPPVEKAFARKHHRRRMAKSVAPYLRPGESLQAVIFGTRLSPAASGWLLVGLVFVALLLAEWAQTSDVGAGVFLMTAAGFWFVLLIPFLLVLSLILHFSAAGRVIAVTDRRILICRSSGYRPHAREIIRELPRTTPLNPAESRGTRTLMNVGETVYVQKQYAPDLALADATMPRS